MQIHALSASVRGLLKTSHDLLPHPRLQLPRLRVSSLFGNATRPKRVSATTFVFDFPVPNLPEARYPVECTKGVDDKITLCIVYLYY